MMARGERAADRGSLRHARGRRAVETKHPGEPVSLPANAPKTDDADVLSRCLECGCERLVPRGHKLVLDPRRVVFPLPVPTVDCDDCGRLYARNEVWLRRRTLGAAPLVRH